MSYLVLAASHSRVLVWLVTQRLESVELALKWYSYLACTVLLLISRSTSEAHYLLLLSQLLLGY